MTGSSHADIDTLVAEWQQNHRDRAVAALKGDAALLAQVKEEIARLETAGPRNLLVHDEVSRQLHRVLAAMVAATAEEKIIAR